MLGIKDFIYFISSSTIQDALLPVKLVCVGFTLFFLAGVIYFMMNSSWLQYKFLEDTTEFFSWKSYGEQQIVKRWEKIKKRMETGSEADYKLAIIEADDFLMETLDERGYEGENFEEALKSASRLVSSMFSQIMDAHQVRNSVVYDPNFSLPAERAKGVLAVYEAAVNLIGLE